MQYYCTPPQHTFTTLRYTCHHYHNMLFKTLLRLTLIVKTTYTCHHPPIPLHFPQASQLCKPITATCQLSSLAGTCYKRIKLTLICHCFSKNELPTSNVVSLNASSSVKAVIVAVLLGVQSAIRR